MMQKKVKEVYKEIHNEIGSAFIKNLHEHGIDSIASYIGSIR